MKRRQQRVVPPTYVLLDDDDDNDNNNNAERREEEEEDEQDYASESDSVASSVVSVSSEQLQQQQQLSTTQSSGDGGARRERRQGQRRAKRRALTTANVNVTSAVRAPVIPPLPQPQPQPQPQPPAPIAQPVPQAQQQQPQPQPRPQQQQVHAIIDANDSLPFEPVDYFYHTDGRAELGRIGHVPPLSVVSSPTSPSSPKASFYLGECEIEFRSRLLAERLTSGGDSSSLLFAFYELQGDIQWHLVYSLITYARSDGFRALTGDIKKRCINLPQQQPTEPALPPGDWRQWQLLYRPAAHTALDYYLFIVDNQRRTASSASATTVDKELVHLELSQATHALLAAFALSLVDIEIISCAPSAASSTSTPLFKLVCRVHLRDSPLHKRELTEQPSLLMKTHRARSSAVASLVAHFFPEQSAHLLVSTNDNDERHEYSDAYLDQLVTGHASHSNTNGTRNVSSKKSNNSHDNLFDLVYDIHSETARLLELREADAIQEASSLKPRLRPYQIQGLHPFLSNLSDLFFFVVDKTLLTSASARFGNSIKDQIFTFI